MKEPQIFYLQIKQENTVMFPCKWQNDESLQRLRSKPHTSSKKQPLITKVINGLILNGIVILIASLML